MPTPRDKDKKNVNIALRKFKIQWVGDNKIIVLIGPRGRGKSTILLDYLFWNQDIPYCACISPTENLNATYSNHIPSRFIFTKYTPKLLEAFLKRQKDLCSKKRAAMSGYGDSRFLEVDSRGLLIMDDCLADNTHWKKDPSLRWIFMNGRHANITFILTMQYQVGIPPELRVNIDWVFICREVKKIEKDKLHKYYAGIFPSYEMFNQIFNKCTKNKCCMVINSLSDSERIEDQVFWFHADLHEKFRVCYDEFWKDNEIYLRRRLQLSDDNSPASIQAKQQEDEYYKYVGGRGNKIRYNLQMGDDDDDDDDADADADAGSGGMSAYDAASVYGQGSYQGHNAQSVYRNRY